jgi:hypothetical protein
LAAHRHAAATASYFGAGGETAASAIQDVESAMLFTLFSRSSGASARPPAARRTPARDADTKKSSFVDSDFEPLPLPEVKEGSGPEDWALWEDSVAAFEQSFEPRARERHPTGDSRQGRATGEIDVFAKVRRHDP